MGSVDLIPKSRSTFYVELEFKESGSGVYKEMKIIGSITLFNKHTPLELVSPPLSTLPERGSIDVLPLTQKALETIKGNNSDDTYGVAMADFNEPIEFIQIKEKIEVSGRNAISSISNFIKSTELPMLPTNNRLF